MTRWGPFAIAFTVTCVFFIDFCAFVFACGCRALWAGADATCNIHAASGHHCPWCSHGYAGYAVVMLLIAGPQLAVSLLPRWHWALRTLAALALFPALGAVIAAAFGWNDGY